jgi:hypothetical protein
MYAGDGTGILSSGSISGGTGNDTITGTGTGYSTIYGGTGGDGVGISNTGKIDGDAGKDSIVGTGTGGQGGFAYADRTSAGGKGIGIKNTGSISGGTEDDSITGIGTGGEGGKDTGGQGIIIGLGGDGIGIANSSNIDGGNGNDVIKGIGIGGTGKPGSNGRGVGISNTAGSINAGNGNDQVLGYGTSVGLEGNGVNVVGIDGGVGDDLFKARKISGLNAQGNPIESANQDGAIANIFISGDNGNDIFDLGFGTAKLSGGQGYDTLLLPVLGSGSYTIGTPDVNGFFQIKNTASTNVLTVSGIEHILSGGTTLV